MTHGARTVVSISRCAALLTEAGDPIERSALSRYCDTHRLKLESQGREVLVDFHAVQAHRQANYQRSVMKGEDAPPLDLVAAAPAAPVASRPVENLDDRRRLHQAKATNEELDLAERMGELTEIAEVDAGAADAIVEMRSAFAGAAHDQAEILAAELGLAPDKTRILRAGLKRFGRIGQERFALKIAEALTATKAGETEQQAYDRLMILAGHAMRLRPTRRAVVVRA